MNVNDQVMLSAYLDGELGSPEELSLKKRLISEPELRSTLDEMKATDDLLIAFSNQINETDVPDGIQALLPAMRERQHAHGFFAAAAAVVLMVGGYFAMNEEPIAYAWLDQLESGEFFSVDGGQVEVIASFYRHDGVVCREAATNQKRAVFCREQGAWQLVVESKNSTVPDGSYAPASAGDVDVIDAYVASKMQGMVLDAAEEQKLIQEGWR